MWYDHAACKGMPGYMFLVPDLKGRASGEEIAKIAKNLRKGREVCMTCPVIADCLEDASDEDLLASLRGGQIPAQFARADVPEKTRKRGAANTSKQPRIPEAAAEIHLLADVSMFHVCDSGHPVSVQAIADSDLPDRLKRRSGTDPDGRCLQCKKSILGRWSQKIRRIERGYH